MPLFLLDRDGVVVVNRKDNIKTPAGLELIPGAAEAIARLNGAGFDVAICEYAGRKRRPHRSHPLLHLRMQDSADETGGRHAAGGACDLPRQGG